jgi:hypothetical protein
MNVEAIYAAICKAGDTAGAIRNLQDATLAALITDLVASGIHSGVPAEIAAMCQIEAAQRWMEEQPTPGAVGEAAL